MNPPSHHPTHQHHHTPIQDAAVVAEATVRTKQRILQAVAAGRAGDSENLGQGQNLPTLPSPGAVQGPGRYLRAWPKPDPHSGQLIHPSPAAVIHTSHSSPLFYLQTLLPVHGLRGSRQGPALSGPPWGLRLQTPGRGMPDRNTASLPRGRQLPPPTLAMEW